jgi:hypothetical protein
MRLRMRMVRGSRLFPVKQGAIFFVRTVAKYGIAMDLQPRIHTDEHGFAKGTLETTNERECARIEGSSYKSKQRERSRRFQNTSTNFSKFYFHKRRRVERKGAKTATKNF